jgi:hypothetical protein
MSRHARIRKPTVANLFYPGDAEALQGQIKAFLQLAMDSVDDNEPRPKAIIAPHAGYIYSGPIAASAYARIVPLHDKIHRVVLLGPSHRVPLLGVAASSADFFSTPFGDIPLDRSTIDALEQAELVTTLDAAHDMEHSLEVHLPFLQTVLDNFSLVPLVVGSTTADQISRLIEFVWNEEDTLIVVSSDLSHYENYRAAQQHDQKTNQAIERLDFQHIGPHDACGCSPLNGLLHFAQQHHLHVKTVDYRNSGDTAGTKDQVVGYGAYVLH